MSETFTTPSQSVKCNNCTLKKRIQRHEHMLMLWRAVALWSDSKEGDEMGKQKCISKENGRNFSKYNQMTGVGTRKTQEFILFMFWNSRFLYFTVKLLQQTGQNLIFSCVFLSTLSQTVIHVKPAVVVFTALIAWKLGLNNLLTSPLTFLAWSLMLLPQGLFCTAACPKSSIEAFSNTDRVGRTWWF